MRPIGEIAAKLGITDDELELYGKYKAKVTPETWQRVKDRPNGKLILVTAINPTPAGEGKTTTSVGLADAFARQGKKTAVALREPSLGPETAVDGVADPLLQAYAFSESEISLPMYSTLGVPNAEYVADAVLDIVRAHRR